MNSGHSEKPFPNTEAEEVFKTNGVTEEVAEGLVTVLTLLDSESSPLLSESRQRSALQSDDGLLNGLPSECRHIQLLQTSQPRVASFTIQLFQMLNHSVAYLHCELGVCLHGKTGCEQGCSESVEMLPPQSDRKSYGNLHNLISFGPILRMKNKFLYPPVEGICIPSSHSETKSPENILSEESCRIHENGLPLLHLMVIQGNWKKVKLLLSCKASVYRQGVCGHTPLTMAADSNIQGACFGHASFTKLLASQGADLEKKRQNHQTLLHVDVERGKFRVDGYLLKKGASVHSLDQNHYSALHMAAVKGKYIVCEKLIKYGANVDLRTDKGWTPLHLASFKGHVEIIHLLKDSHAKVNVKGSVGWTPLHLTARVGEEPVVCELLRCGADPNVAEKSWALLHLAVQQGSFLSHQSLECKADVNAKDKVVWTPLHLAVLKGNMAIIKTLIMAHALLDVEDITGCTALLACRHQRENKITLLQGTDSPVNR
ncbi:LOW QUALITY PROTEIN: ankyrin repeat and protein kinase domain-containing protein 1 [Eudromia elegans]